MKTCDGIYDSCKLVANLHAFICIRGRKTAKETNIVGWKTKTSSEKKLGIAIYDILTENKYPEDKVNEITMKVIDLAKQNLP